MIELCTSAHENGRMVIKSAVFSWIIVRMHNARTPGSYYNFNRMK